jgi:two-component system sensor histidine kinase SenX3
MVAAVVVGVLALIVAAAVATVLVRRRVAEQLRGVAAGLHPDAPAATAAGLEAAIDQVERAAAQLRADGEATSERWAQLKVAVDALPLGVVVVDREERALLRNSAADHFLGVRHADALVQEAVRAKLKLALRGQPATQVLDLHGPPRRTVMVRALPVEVGAQHIAIATIEDVSERARLEAMRTDFVANISHELRTPVGALALLAETMVEEDEPALMRRLAAKMVTESSRVARIMEDLLELSRLEHDGRPQTEVVPVGLLASEAVERVRTLADQREIRVAVEEPSRRLTVMGDRRQLVSALANLIENGVKYSDPGSTVDVSAHTDGQWVTIAVADHGIGIPQRDQDRIFERFYRVDRARSRDTGGTGLGLAIVRHVATNHGGAVAVESSEGEGSTFTVRIPSGPGPVAVTMSEAG